MAKYLGTHMPALQVVGVRYAAAFLIALMFSNPLNRPGLLRTARARPATLALGDAARLDRVQLHGVPLSPARRGAGDPVLDAVPGRDPGRPDARRMGRLAALDRDHGRLRSACWWWCAPAWAACSGRRCSRSAARSATPATASPRGCCRATNSSETTLFYANLFGFVVMVPVLPFVWTPPPSWIDCGADGGGGRASAPAGISC